MTSFPSTNTAVAVAHAPLEAQLSWHRLEDHLRSVGSLAADRIVRVADPIWGTLAGNWHDLGKYAPDWQDFIRSAVDAAAAVEAHVEEDDEQPLRRRGPDHSTAGAIHAVTRMGIEVGGPLAFAISGHHAGIPNNEDLRERLKKEEKQDRYRASIAAADGLLPGTEHGTPPWPSWFKTIKDRDIGRRSLEFFTRMLFSALVDADFLDTEAYFATAGNERARWSVNARQGAWPVFTAYRAVLDQHLEAKAHTTRESTVNRLRRAVLDACRTAASNSSGLFTLTVPTGGGKTLASLAFALDHAAQHGHRRVVVALPFTSIIEQTAQVFRDVFGGLGSDVVLEHHSALNPTKATARGRVSSENWDAPLVVTTQVQLFESLFANRPAACRKLHSLIGSVLILDEVQSLPSSLLEPILDVVDELASHYDVTVVLTTATQPALHRRDLGATVFRGFKQEPREIIPPNLATTLWDGLRRVTVHWPGADAAALPPPDEVSTFWSDLGNQVATHDQALVITHLKQDAQDLWQAVSHSDSSALHLSAAMCAEHRGLVLANVKRRLDAGITCRLVSTQVIEAGVDIDFPVVYRAMAGLESLAQSAGRCNREGRLNRGEFFVFEAPTRPPRTLRLHQDVARQMLDADPQLDLSSPATFRRYFDRLYAHQDLDRPGIQEARGALRFKDTATLFRMIDAPTVSVFVPFDQKARRLLAQLRLGGLNRGVLHGLQRYAVNVYQKQLDSLQAEGAVEETGTDQGMWSLCSDIHYHPVLGLRTKADPSVAMII
jgi:CRISPR-associated endonuclease/helicase Cas3